MHDSPKGFIPRRIFFLILIGIGIFVSIGSGMFTWHKVVRDCAHTWHKVVRSIMDVAMSQGQCHEDVSGSLT